MIENEVIVRLELMVERLNRVLEQNLIAKYQKQWRQNSSDSEEATIGNLLKIYPALDDLHMARAAKELLVSGKKRAPDFALKNYLKAASIVYDLLCELPANDMTKVNCGVEIRPTLKKALKKAMNVPDLHTEALNVYNFVTEQAPVWSWAHEDITYHMDRKVFRLTKSEEFFEKLLRGKYIELTKPEDARIRIAFYKGDTRIIRPNERAEKETLIKKTVDKVTGERFWALYGFKSMAILYPETLHLGTTYVVFVPVE